MSDVPESDEKLLSSWREAHNLHQASFRNEVASVAFAIVMGALLVEGRTMGLVSGFNMALLIISAVALVVAAFFSVLRQISDQLMIRIAASFSEGTKAIALQELLK